MLLVKEEFLKLNMVNSFHPIILSLKDSRTVCIVPMVYWCSQEEKMGWFFFVNIGENWSLDSFYEVSFS